MFKFFTKRWVSRKDYEEKVKELVFEVQEKHQIWEKYFKKEGELLNIIEEKEKTIQRLESKLSIALLKLLKLKLMDDWEREVGELNCTLGESKEKEQDEEAWIIPFCIEELKKLNKKLEDYSPSSPELAELDVREVVFRLALEMRVQNNIMAQALLALNLKKPVNIEDNA